MAQRRFLFYVNISSYKRKYIFMTKIKFGTDGWRAIIAKDFTVDNVAKVTVAVATWLNNKYKNPVAVIGYDFRFGGKMFAETVAKVLSTFEVKVQICNCAV